MATTTDWDVLVAAMDDEIREQVHGELVATRAARPRAVFAARYAELHEERLGEEWPGDQLASVLDRALAEEEQA